MLPQHVPTFHPRHLVATLFLATMAVPTARAQGAALYDQVTLAASHNGVLRSRSIDADRLLNAIDLARAQLFDALRDAAPDAEARDARFGAYLATDLFVRPPRMPMSRTAGGQPFRQLVPEAAAILDWSHAFRRQVYDVLASSGTPREKSGRITELLGYYRSRPALAISSRPKDVGALNAQFGATAFRVSHPKVNGQLWATQWLELAMAEALLAPASTSGGDSMSRALDRFRAMLAASPGGAPYLMPVSTAVAPTLVARYPDVAAIFDNLHLLQDYIADLMVAPDVPRSAHRRELVRAIQLFREDTTASSSYSTWMAATETMGARNMGGVGVGFPEVPEEPTVVRGMSLASQSSGGMPGMDHAAMQMRGGQDTTALRAVLDRMLADPVIRERVATDPALQRMLPQSGMTAPAAASGMAGMQHGNMPGMQNMPQTPGMPAMPMPAGARETDEERRLRNDFIVKLLTDPTVESRIHADPQLHRLWSDPDVQRRLQELRQARSTRNP